MTAFVLAAGLGQRMRPLTSRRAKSTLPVLGSPILARIMAHLVRSGFERLVVNAHHAQTSILEVVERHAPDGASVEISEERELMGTAGALAGPRESLRRSEWFLIHNGDTLIDDDFERLLAAAREGGHAGALLVRRGATSGFGALKLREDRLDDVVSAGDVAGAREPLATYLGVAVLHRELLDRVPDDRPSQLFGDLLLPLVREGQSIGTCRTDGEWLEFTSPAAYRRNLTDIVKRGRDAGRVSLPGGAAPVEATPDGALFVAPEGEVHRSAKISGGVVVELGACIGPHAHLLDSILLERAVAGGESNMRRAMLDTDAELSHEETLEDATLSAGERGLVRHPC